MQHALHRPSRLLFGITAAQEKKEAPQQHCSALSVSLRNEEKSGSFYCILVVFRRNVLRASVCVPAGALFETVGTSQGGGYFSLFFFNYEQWRKHYSYM